MTKELIKIKDLKRAIHDAQNDINEITEGLWRNSLRNIVEYKIKIAARVLEDSLYVKNDKNGFVAGILGQNEGIRIKKSVLYDAMAMFEKEELKGSPNKQTKFLNNFAGNYASWNEYRQKELGVGGDSTAMESSVGCRKCPIKGHCPK